MSTTALITAMNDAKINVHAANFQGQRSMAATVLRDAGRKHLADRLAKASNVEDFRTECAATASILYAEDTPQKRTGSPLAAALPESHIGRPAQVRRTLTKKQAGALTETHHALMVGGSAVLREYVDNLRGGIVHTGTDDCDDQWKDADTVLVATDDAPALAARGLPVRARVILVSADAATDVHFRAAIDLGAAYVIELPTARGWLAEYLNTPAPPSEVGRPAQVGRTLTKKQADALAVFLDNIDSYCLSDLGPHLTCSEADTIANVFRAFGYDGDADTLIEGHAEEDEKGDAHYVEPEREPGRCRQVGRISGYRYQCGAKAEEGSDYCLTHSHLAAV